jgi:hypothetical protein
MGIAALAAGCGGAIEDGLHSGGPDEQGGSGGSSSNDDANDGDENSGSAGDDSGTDGGTDGGGTGEAGSGSTGVAGSGNTGEAGSGNTGGSSSGGGTDGQCEVSQCESADVGGFISLPGCCPDNGGGCGLDVSAAEQYAGVTGCIELDQEGHIDPQCPTETRPAQPPIPETEFPGCCRPDNSCGYMVDMSQFGVPSFGCADASVLGGPSVGVPCNY